MTPDAAQPQNAPSKSTAREITCCPAAVWIDWTRFSGNEASYAARSDSVAERFRIAVDRAVARVEAEADALPFFSGPYRWVRVRRFPYLLICRRKSAEVIMIVAVAHTSRRPGYWRRRL